jgi:putative ABC transport system permease protein
MYLLNALSFSKKNLLANKTRSFLTILGIIIGIAAIIIIMAIGNSAQSLILKQVEGIGSNLIAVTPGASEEVGPPASVFGIVTKTLADDDLEDIRNDNQIRGLKAISGYANGTVLVTRRSEDSNVSLMGVNSGHLKIAGTEIDQGTFFTEKDDKSLEKNVVLGYEIAEEFFKNENPINQKIKIDSHQFRVIGVLEKEDSSAFGVSDQNNSVFIPLRTAQKLVLGIDYLNFIRIKIENVDQINQAKKRVREILRENHNIDDPSKDDFSIKDQAMALDMLKNITDIIRYFLLTVASVALLVGGIGIMNIMLISVNQRIKEVGLRKAIGAKNKDVLAQFLVESIFVSLIGGIIGIILGILVSFIIYLVINYLGYEWAFMISVSSVVVAVVVSMVVGIIFGIYPAKKASRISPMEALHYE